MVCSGLWFQVVDINGDGRLDQREVLEVLRATLPVDSEKLERDLPRLWRGWDKDGDGTRFRSC